MLLARFTPLQREIDQGAEMLAAYDRSGSGNLIVITLLGQEDVFFDLEACRLV
jgi:hypothetical protein